MSARPRVTETSCISRCLTAFVSGLLLTVFYFLTGCGGGGGGGDGQAATPPDTGITASLAWNKDSDPSVIAYFVHYGRQSPGQPGSCAYEASMYVQVASPSATVTNLEPDTRYYFAVSAYNGLESTCSA